jgi:hypothetical protein
MFKRPKFLPLLLLLAIAACKPEETENPSIGYDYFPLHIGKTLVFAFDSIAFNDNTKSSDTFYYELTWRVDTFFTNQSGYPVYVINQSVKDTGSGNVFNRMALFAEINPQQLVITENQLAFVKLVFPLGNVTSWNGNMYNTLFRQTYQLKYFNKPENGLNTAFVQEANNINAIEEEVRYSIYAQNIGLIAFYSKYLNKQIAGTSGYIVQLKILPK